MRRSKLIQMFQGLSNNEFQIFGDFIRSPFFNKNKKCIALYDLLFRYFPEFDAPEMNDAGFYEKIYSNKKSLEVTKEKLLRLLERYLIQKGLEQTEELQKYLLLEELRRRNKFKHYNLIHKQFTKKIIGKEQSVAVFYGIYLLEVSRMEMLYQLRVPQEDKAFQLEKTIRAFDQYLLSNHFWLDSLVLNSLSFRSGTMIDITKEVIHNSQTFIHFANEQTYANNPLVELQLLLLQLLEKKQEKNFIQLFDTLKENHTIVSDFHNKQFHLSLTNYCIVRIHQGDETYYKKLLNVYMFAMDIGILIEGEYLSPFRMKNILIVSIKSNQLDLTHKLLDEYFTIDPKYYDVTEVYCRGYLHFHKKEYDTAIDYLRQCMDFKSLFELDAQSILYKIYYETNEDWAFDIPIESFMAKILRRSGKHPKNKIQGHINFFRILKQIYRKKVNTYYKKSSRDIRSKISSMKYLSDKQWLLEKIKELEG